MSNPFSSVTLEQLHQRTSEKWRHYGPDVLPMWVAEMDVMLAPAVQEAIIRAVKDGDTGYASGNKYELAYADFSQRHWDLKLDPDYIVGVIDVIRGLMDVIRLATPEDAPIIITPPVYYPFAIVVNATGRELLNAQLTPEGRFDFTTLEDAFRKAEGRGGMVLISNPSNPTGVVHTAEELTTLAVLAKKYGVRILSDEIHAPLTMPGFTFVSILAIPEAEDAVVVTSASKSFNLAGLKAALVVTHSASSALVEKLREPIVQGPTHLGVISHEAALLHSDQWLKDVVTGINENSVLMTELVETYLPGAQYRPLEATYLGWVDCSPLDLGPDPAKVFLEKGKVAFNSGHTFGPGGHGHIRVNMGTSPEILTEAMRRAGSAL